MTNPQNINSKNYSPTELKALILTSQYIYRNKFTRWATLLGHFFCAKLTKHDFAKDTIVDLGCGSGDHFPFIKNARIIGVDNFPEMLEIAEKKSFPRAELRKDDILYLSTFLDKSVHSIISFGTLEHIQPLDQALKQILRILSDHGEFVFGIPTEGFLFKLGRNLSTKPHIEKITGIDYYKLLEKEHVNKCQDIITELKKYFIIDKLLGVPFLIPIRNLNIFLVGRCIKKSPDIYNA